eukprot:CAMPEP_0180796834 /NCGR_PEP_ID=MMETSP1038_2-20121128/57025_1 /TAXON_ID=632150 /ORGANISM="Azadinium spinosum, Strain 3D9" /LENGTH=113 /DNA_ID=CAMNT_0022836009 /DNA_START=273 /DNA_END=612 /DNA_ORIENTATION=-
MSIHWDLQVGHLESVASVGSFHVDTAGKAKERKCDCNGASSTADEPWSSDNRSSSQRLKSAGALLPPLLRLPWLEASALMASSRVPYAPHPRLRHAPHHLRAAHNSGVLLASA